MSEDKVLKINKIGDGIVIDHISPGVSLDVLEVLKITGKEGMTVSLLMNVQSGKVGTKDIIKIEKKKLAKKDLDKISLVSPNATINVISNYEIREKFTVEIPQIVTGVIRCSNQNCVTNSKEPVQTLFQKEKSGDGEVFRCHYCDRTMSLPEVRKSIIR
ncbi:MAG: aspartate carbamoyltransferase regulatory subunit [Candidatus Thermoplasmatota archaeon]|jgi:aspartate carbamoyltransferase regulatory subunit|nr:aspartate carbamoyltransferase regulatory subunit [Candidatus Thermoplasmatota archaeon]